MNPKIEKMLIQRLRQAESILKRVDDDTNPSWLKSLIKDHFDQYRERV